jgi:hypothetical protein
MKYSGATHDYVKYLSDYVTRIEKDFTYLQHPVNLPRAYEKGLIEITRRRKFRKIADEEYNKLKLFIQKEKEARTMFLNEYGKLFPNDFLPQLRDA